MNKHAEWLKRSTLPNDIDAAAEIESLQARIAELESMLKEAKKPKVCVWTKLDGLFSRTSCGHILNDFRDGFCKRCGGEVVVK